MGFKLVLQLIVGVCALNPGLHFPSSEVLWTGMAG
jgi:hypothetical protein